jgi:bacillithiol biosynthesis deacetylase BshB1
MKNDSYQSVGLDLLAYAPHPDDAELACGGTLARLVTMGYNVGVVDLTEGESGTRGTPETRSSERKKATDVLGLKIRERVGLPDTGVNRSDRGQLEKVVQSLRRYRPRVVLAPHWGDRHPDHVEASHLVASAVFMAGVSRFGKDSPPFKSSALVYYPGSLDFAPSLVVDISAQFETKMRAIACYSSQFSLRSPGEPATDIAHPHFLERVKARARHFGLMVGVEYGEPFFLKRPVAISDPIGILAPRDKEGA